MIIFIVESPTMCHPDQRAGGTILENFEGIYKYTTLFKPYIFGNKACNLRLAIAQRCVTCSLKLKLLSIVTPKRTSG